MTMDKVLGSDSWRDNHFAFWILDPKVLYGRSCSLHFMMWPFKPFFYMTMTLTIHNENDIFSDVPTASLYRSFHNCKLGVCQVRISKYQLYVAATRKGISQQSRHINATTPLILRQEREDLSLDLFKCGPCFHMFIGSRCGQRAHDGSEVATLINQSDSLFNLKVFRSLFAALHECQQTLHWFLKLLGQRHGTLKVDLLFAHINNCSPRAPWIFESTKSRYWYRYRYQLHK